MRAVHFRRPARRRAVRFDTINGVTSHPPDHNRPFQPPQSPPGQAPYTPSQAFQPPPGQPGQPPYPGQPLQGPPQPYGQPAQPVQPYGQPAELPAQPQGPPANATAGRSALWPVALVVLSLVVVAASYWMGTYLGVYGNRGISFYLLIALVAVTVAAWSRSGRRPPSRSVPGGATCSARPPWAGGESTSPTSRRRPSRLGAAASTSFWATARAESCSPTRN